jgi:hypothetical protein
VRGVENVTVRDAGSDWVAVSKTARAPVTDRVWETSKSDDAMRYVPETVRL